MLHHIFPEGVSILASKGLKEWLTPAERRCFGENLPDHVGYKLLKNKFYLGRLRQTLFDVLARKAI